MVNDSVRCINDVKYMYHGECIIIIMNTYVYCQILLYLKNIIPHAVGNSKIFCHLIFKQELSNAPNKIRSGQIRHH